jgi:type VI protein secretion system component VasF
MPPRKPSPAEILNDRYQEMAPEELARQGRELLRNDAREGARRAARWGKLVMWTLLGGAVVLVAVFSLWLMSVARKSGSSFAEMKNQAMKAYVDSDE